MYLEFTHQRLTHTSRHRLMLLVIRFYTLPDLFHNFCSIDSALCFEIVTFRIVLFSYDDHLEKHPTSASRTSHCQGEALTYSERLRMSSANFTTYNHTEWHPARLHAAIEQCLPRLSG